MPAADLRAALHRTADLVADYIESVEDYAVLPAIEPGELTERLAGPPPRQPEPLDAILRDVDTLEDYRAIARNAPARSPSG